MPLNLPDNQTIVNRELTDIQANLEGSNPFLPNSFLNAIGVANAGRFNELYQQLSLAQKATFLSTADLPDLTVRANELGVYQEVATISYGNLIFTGTNGVVVPAGTQASLNGINYVATNSGTISNNTVTATSLTSTGLQAIFTCASNHNLANGMQVTISNAVQPQYNGTYSITILNATQFTYTMGSLPGVSTATGTIQASSFYCTVPGQSLTTGQITNISGGSSLTLSSNVSGVNSTIYTDYNGFTGGTDLEDIELFRKRALAKLANPYTPFNDISIIEQAQTVAGVTRVWVYDANSLLQTNNAMSITVSGNLATVNFSSAHNLLNGMSILIQSASNSALNNYFAVLVTSSTQIMFPVTLANGTYTGNVLYPQVQLGQTAVYFVRDNDTNRIPNATQNTAVKNALLAIKSGEMSANNLLVNVGLSSTYVDFVFTSLTPSTTNIKNAISANLKALFLSLAMGQTCYANQYIQAIESAYDTATNQQVTNFTLSGPTGDIVPNYNQILLLRNITFNC